MDRFRACLLGRLDDPIRDEIGLGSGRRPDQNGLVGHVDMDCVTIRFGIDGYRLDAHPLRGFYHTACDFAAVGDKDFLEHGGPLCGGDRKLRRLRCFNTAARALQCCLMSWFGRLCANGIAGGHFPTQRPGFREIVPGSQLAPAASLS